MEIYYVVIPFSGKASAESMLGQSGYSGEVVKEAPCLKKLFDKAYQERISNASKVA